MLCPNLPFVLRVQLSLVVASGFFFLCSDARLVRCLHLLPSLSVVALVLFTSSLRRPSLLILPL